MEPSGARERCVQRLEVLAQRDALDQAQRQTAQAIRLSVSADRLSRLLFAFAALSLILTGLSFVKDLVSGSLSTTAQETLAAIAVTASAAVLVAVAISFRALATSVCFELPPSMSDHT